MEIANMEDSAERRKHLFKAVSEGDLALLRQILQKDPNAIFTHWGVYSTWFHLAADQGHIHLCEAFIEWGMDINITDSDIGKDTPLQAASKGHVDLVHWFLDNGAEVDGRSYSVSTPLTSAAIDGHLDVVKILLDAGAEINREHLRRPATALDWAEGYRVKNTGQDLVCDYLREQGGIRAYSRPDGWQNEPNVAYLDHIERSAGIVRTLCVEENPLDLDIRLRKAVVVPKNCEFQLLFTDGLFASTDLEVGLCLPGGWPFNRMSLKEAQYRRPVEMLSHIGHAVKNGEKISHGDVIDATHPVLKGGDAFPGIKQWLMVVNRNIEEDRRLHKGLPTTLIAVPILTAKGVKPGEAAKALADKKSTAKWKALAIPSELQDGK